MGFIFSPFAGRTGDRNEFRQNEAATQLVVKFSSVGIAEAVPTEATSRHATAATRASEMRFIDLPFLGSLRA